MLYLLHTSDWMVPRLREAAMSCSTASCRGRRGEGERGAKGGEG